MFQPGCRPRAAALLTLALLVVGVSLAGPDAAVAQGRSIYVAPNGVAGRDGSLANPIDLVSALSSSGPARPGDTIWLRGGTYRGAFTSTLNGTSTAPITVRQYPGERATLDNGGTPTLPTLVVNGSWTVFWGFEIMNSNPTRFIDISGRGTGLDVYGANTKFINLVIHDAQNGVGFWSSAVNAELYGSLIFNNGIEWTDRGHGHSIYTQNASGTKRIQDNIMFNGFSFGIHAYTQGGAIDNFVMDGNVSFNHGVLSSGGLKSDLLLGGGQVARNPVITNNHLYNSPGLGGRGADIGYGTACTNGTVQNNVFVSDTALMFNCSATTLSGNQIYGGYNVSAGSYPSNTYHSSRPTGSWVSVRPNRYEPGRGHIVIYNWARAAQVAVNLSQAGLAAGDVYEIRDAQNFYGPPIATGVYGGGTVNVPMTSTVVALPVGNAHVTPRHTGPDFGVFVVMRTSGTATPPAEAPTASLTVSPATITAGQSATLSWTTANATSVTINQGIGTVAASGTLAVSPSATTTFTLTATNSAGVSTTSTATVTVTAAPVTQATAAFVATDTVTQGNWRGVYGAEGHAIAQSSTALPSFAQLSVNGPAYTWTAATTEPRALQLPSGTGRIASAWYSTQSFEISLNLTDGQPHRVAVYALDWDRQLRAQRFEIVDAGSGTVLDTRQAANFADGIYWVWRLSGRVIIRVVRTGGPSPVAAAVFIDTATTTAPPPPTAAPTVTIAATPASISAGQAATLSWSSTNATLVSIDQGIGTVGATGSRTVTPAATTTYTVTASNASGQVSASTTVTVAAAPPPSSSGTAAAFVGTDTTTQGNWRGIYGDEGFGVAPTDIAWPAYAQVAVGGAAYTWDANPSDVRALLRSSGTSRVAATWYSSDAFAFNVRITDGQTHQVSLYSLDWDRQGRAQSIEVLDAATMAVLDRRDLASFGNGVYHRWTIKGHVIFRITRTAGPSPVIAGLLFGAASSSAPSAPTVSLSASPTTISPGQSSTLSWSSANATSVTLSPNIGAVSASGTRTVAPLATTTYTVTATNAAGQSVSATATVNVTATAPPPSSGAASATFLGVDDVTKGNWRNVYGTQGYALAPSTSAMPATTPTTINGLAWTWVANTTDVRALLLPSGTARAAATWYGTTTMSIDVNLTDGQRHQIAVYGLDWDRQGRAQVIEVVDAATGTVLDRQTSGAFGDGRYWVWEVTGRVTLRVTKTAGPSPALAGIFIDPN